MAPLKNLTFITSFWHKTAFWKYVSKCKLDANFDLAIPGIHSKERKSKYNKCVQKMLITASFITVKSWKEPKCPLSETVIKLRYIQPIEYMYSFFKMCYPHLLT